MLRKVELKDAEEICEIYNYYVKNTTVSFEELPVSVEDMKNRIINICSILPYFVYEDNGTIVGYAYATKWKERSAYKFSVETTVYLHHKAVGGIGTKLYEALLTELKSAGIHRAMGGIALPNIASVRLHEKLGFQKVAEFNEVGFKHDQWINVGYWEYKL